MQKAVRDSLFSSVIQSSCFSRLYRLTSKNDFQSVFDQSHKAVGKGVITLFRPNERDYPRLGITISKHQIKRAVDRNRLRRVIRESFRNALNTVTGFDIVIMPRKEWIKFDQTHCRAELSNLWQQIAQKRNKGDA